MWYCSGCLLCFLKIDTYLLFFLSSVVHSTMSQITFSDGTLILIEGNKNGKEWFPALPWQADRFIEAIQFGTMKTMGSTVNPRTETDPFVEGAYRYQFIILNDWGPCYLRNVTTGKEREIKYFHLNSSQEVLPYSEPNHSPVQIKVKRK